MEAIAQMKPKAPNDHEDGLLEYLEDIIGTEQYKKPIEEYLVRLEGLNEEYGEKLARVKHIEKEKNALEVNFVVVVMAGWKAGGGSIHGSGKQMHKIKNYFSAAEHGGAKLTDL